MHVGCGMVNLRQVESPHPSHLLGGVSRSKMLAEHRCSLWPEARTWKKGEVRQAPKPCLCGGSPSISERGAEAACSHLSKPAGSNAPAS